MKKNWALRVLLGGSLVLCLCFFIVYENPGDKHLNEQYEKNSFDSIIYKEEMTVSGTLEQVSTQFIGRKGKTHMFSLGFYPTTDNISEFEQILMNDFNGEIEIVLDYGQLPTKKINYRDFDGFAWSPDRDTYGPLYYFNIENGGIQYSFRPKIRAKEACTYSFHLQRVKKSFGESVKDFFKSEAKDEDKLYTTGSPKSEDEMINIPVVMRRINMYIEKKGRCTVTIGTNVPTEFRDIYSHRGWFAWLVNNFDGNIKIYKNGKEYFLMPYDNIGKDGKRHVAFYKGLVHSFYIDAPDMYSFVPDIKSRDEFSFSIEIKYMRGSELFRN